MKSASTPIWGQLENLTSDTVFNSISRQVSSQIRSQVWHPVWNQVTTQLLNHVEDPFQIETLAMDLSR